MTGRMLIEIEKVLQREMPDWVIVFGDMNSTLAGALSAVKLHIPICHVEAGARTHNLTNPEEVNRVCTDHVSTLLMASSQHDMDELKKENLIERSHFSGNTMYDAFLQYSEKLSVDDIVLRMLDGTDKRIPRTYYYMTCHREENTFSDEPLSEILKAMNDLDAPTIYPVHPRNRDRVFRLNKQHDFSNIIMCEPVGYFESVCLTRNALKIVTDSGGLQTEAFFAGKKCVTVFDYVIWPELARDGLNEITKPKAEEIKKSLEKPMYIDPEYQPFGDGHAAERIVSIIEKY